MFAGISGHGFLNVREFFGETISMYFLHWIYYAVIVFFRNPIVRIVPLISLNISMVLTLIIAQFLPMGSFFLVSFHIPIQLLSLSIGLISSFLIIKNRHNLMTKAHNSPPFL